MTTRVREIKLKNNQVGVMLDRHFNGKRTQKMLDIRYADFPRNAIERQDKKDKKELVKKIVAKMEIESSYANSLLEKEYKLNKDFFEYCDEYLNYFTPAQRETFHSAINQLKKFAKRDNLMCSEMDDAFMLKFRNYLDTQLNGLSPNYYFKRIKKIIKEAIYNKYFKSNPTERIPNRKGRAAKKDILTSDEIQKLNDTPCKNEQVKKAFLFSCLSGLRFSDTSSLKWGNYKDGQIDIIQKKTKEHLILNLHPDARYLIGKSKEAEELIFKLPTLVCCLQHLKKWVAEAGIDKHITWHCSRHSFATTLISKDVNITTVSKLLGHKNILETENYVRVSEMSKRKAINNLPSIF